MKHKTTELTGAVKPCWPTLWLEAAMRAGFAHHKGGGEWVFINDKMRDMLAEFGKAVQAAAVADERERCAKVCEATDEADLRFRYDYRRGALDCADAIRGKRAYVAAKLGDEVEL